DCGSPGWPNELTETSVLKLLPPMSSSARVPGTCASSVVTPARPVGVSSSTSLVSVVVCEVWVTSTIGAAADTVTVSSRLPTFSFTSSRAALVRHQAVDAGVGLTRHGEVRPRHAEENYCDDEQMRARQPPTAIDHGRHP